nr:MAG TPA: hypothetical protein [Caudoviricetes sp.]
MLRKAVSQATRNFPEPATVRVLLFSGLGNHRGFLI